jgi:hypothetical protein
MVIHVVILKFHDMTGWTALELNGIEFITELISQADDEIKLSNWYVPHIANWRSKRMCENLAGSLVNTRYKIPYSDDPLGPVQFLPFYVTPRCRQMARKSSVWKGEKIALFNMKQKFCTYTITRSV